MKHTHFPSAPETRADGGRCDLDRRDLIRFEPVLKELLGRFLRFKNASLYFPRESMPLRWLPEERRLFLPLNLRERQLGVIVATGARVSRRALPLAASLADLCVEYIQLQKRLYTDPLTGLARHDHIMERMLKEIEAARNAGVMSDRSGQADRALMGAEENTLAAPGGIFGVLAFQFHGLTEIARLHGHAIAERLLMALADVFSRRAPRQALAGRGGEHEFILFVPLGTPRVCMRLSAEMTRALAEVSVPGEFTGRVSVSVAAGYVCYPQNLEPCMFARTGKEQARLLLEHAAYAASVAHELRSRDQLREPVMGYARILQEGGRILGPHSLGTVRVSLGQSVGAKEGQHYAVWSTKSAARAAGCPAAGSARENTEGARPEAAGAGSAEPRPEPGARPDAWFRACAERYKGELVLVEARKEDALAEVVSLTDPAHPLAVGDRLTLLPDSRESEDPRRAPVSQGQIKPDQVTGLLRYRDFLPTWAARREECAGFCLALLRLTPGSGPVEPESSPDALLAVAAAQCREMFGSQVLAARYGLNGLILFHPDADQSALADDYRALSALLEETHAAEAVTGIAGYPYLSFHKPDVLENCFKALDYALLLPRPKVGTFNSLAMTISADKRLSAGDRFGAIEQYKLALLADENNVVARNSLGVCLAGLGRHAEARRCFEEALTRDADNVMAHYNLGQISQSLGESGRAWQEYRKCLALNPEHTYAVLRLGQLAEQDERWPQARKLYERASGMPRGQAVTRRYLARLAMKQGNDHEARELLHEALNHNPQDPLALRMLAHLYLRQGDDPEVAVVLARECIALMPEAAAGWLVLAQALEACGRAEEARRARLKAASL